MKTTSCRTTYMAKGPMPPQYKLNDLFNEHFSQLIFFEKYIVAKNWQGGGELLLKNITMDNTLTYHVIDRAGFT